MDWFGDGDSAEASVTISKFFRRDSRLMMSGLDVTGKWYLMRSFDP